MPREIDDEEEDFDEDGYDPEDPETYPQGLYDDDGPPTVPCPHCGKEILEDSERCPSCGMYLSGEDAPRKSQGSAWMVVLILALLAAAMMIFL